MSDIKITVVEPPKKPEPEKKMRAGRFYRHKRRGGLVFAASVDGVDGVVKTTEDCGLLAPADDTPVVAIGGGYNGFSLKGLFEGIDAYEEVDVEITVKPRA